MKKIAISFLLIFLSTSTFAGNHDKLVGEWFVNIEKIKDSDEFKEATKDPKKAERIQRRLRFMANTSITFTKTGFIALTPEPDGKHDEEKANYTTVSDKDKTLEVKLVDKKGRENVIIFTFLDDNNVKMSHKKEIPNLVKVIFLTKKKAKK